MLGSELRSRRRQMRLSQAELGARLGVPPNTIARWERGEMKIQQGELLRLALKHLALDLEEERAALSPEEQYRRNGEELERLRAEADERWERMTPEQQEAARWLLEPHGTWEPEKSAP